MMINYIKIFVPLEVIHSLVLNDKKILFYSAWKDDICVVDAVNLPEEFEYIETIEPQRIKRDGELMSLVRIKIDPYRGSQPSPEYNLEMLSRPTEEKFNLGLTLRQVVNIGKLKLNKDGD